VSRGTSGIIDLDALTAPDEDMPSAPIRRPDMPELGSQRGAAREALRPQDRTLIEDWFNASTFAAPLPKWYTDFGGSALKATESFAQSVGQGLGDLASFLSGGLIDISGTQPIDTSHARELLKSDDPELRLQGERLLEQADYVEGASKEGYRLDLKRNRETPYAGVDPDSFASTAGGLVGNIAPSVAAMVPGLQVPVLAGYFSNAYENAYDEYADTKLEQDGDYDRTTAATVGVVAGAIEAAFEYLPIRGVKKAAEAARKTLVQSAMAGGANWRREAAKAAAKLLATGATQEGIEEGGTELANEILRLTYDKRLQEKYGTDPVGTAAEAAGRIMKAAAAGAAGGLLLGGAGLGMATAGSGGFQGGEASSESSQDATAQEAAPAAVAQPEQVATEPTTEGVPITPQDEAIAQQAKALSGKPTVSPMMEVAFGVGMVERPRVGDVPASRVSRPEAIKALREAGHIPETTDPIDFAHEVATNPVKYRDFIETLRTQPELSRGQASALFGGAETMQSTEDRKAWVDMVIDLADHNSPDRTAGAGQSASVSSPRPPSPPINTVPMPPDGVVDFRNDRLTRFTENRGDQYIKLERLVADTEKAIGRKLADNENPIEVIRLAKSMRADEQRLFHERLGKTFDDMQARKLRHDEVYRLAVAIHAEEANAQVAKRNPDDPTRGAGMSNDVAEQVRDEALAHPESAALYGFAEEMSGLLQERTELDLGAGVLSERDVEGMGVYEDYIAMKDDPNALVTRGDADVAGMENVPRNAYSVGTKQRMDRLGRQYGSLDDPKSPRAKAFYEAGFAHLIELYERGILRRSQNHVLNTVRRFASGAAGKQQGFTVRYKPPVERKLNPKTNTVEWDEESLATYKRRDDVLYGKLDEPVTVDGVEHRIGTPFFIEVSDLELAKTLKNAAVPDPSLANIYAAFRMATAITRLGATSGISVAFPFLNLDRDVQTLNVAISADHADHEKLKRDVAKSLIPAFRTIVLAEMGKDDTSEMRKWYDEMRSMGGILEPFKKNDFDSAQSIVQSRFDPTVLSTARDKAAALIAFASNTTKPFENMTRLALYMQLRRRGVTPQKAAVAARNATIDFEVHGKNTGFMRAGYAFLNASIQGQRRLIRMLRTPGGRRWAGIYFLGGLLQALYAYLGDDDRNEDGKPDAAQLPSWQRDTTFTIPGTNLQSPTMWGMAPAQSLGWWMGETLASTMGKADVDHADNARRVANAVLDSFNPAGGSDAFSGHGLMQLLLPTLLDGLYQFQVNKDWRGSRIYNEPMNAAQRASWVDSQHGMETTPEVYHRIADTLNTITGGDAASSGYVDIAPETIRFVFQSIGGGGARSLERIGEVATAPITGDPKSWLDLPVVSGFTRQFPEPAAVNEEYARERDQGLKYLARVKAYKDMGDQEAIFRLANASPEIAASAGFIEYSEKAIDDLRDLLKEYRAAGAPAESIREINDAIMREKAQTMAAIRQARRNAS